VAIVQGHREPFDLGKLSSRIGQLRAERGVTLAALAQDVGVAASTIRRFRTASDAEADGVLALVSWTGDSPESFIVGSSVDGTPLAEAGTGTIRVDMALVAAVRSERPTTTRTTIQRLASAAQASGRTVASLTRWSSV